MDKEKLTDLIINNVPVLIACVFGLVIPGAFTIFIYKMSYYTELRILNLLFMSFVISAPSFGYLYFVFMFLLRFNMDDVRIGAIIAASMSNFAIFCLAILIKIFNTSMDKRGFVCIILISCVAFTLLFKKELHKSMRNKD